MLSPITLDSLSNHINNLIFLFVGLQMLSPVNLEPLSDPTNNSVFLNVYAQWQALCCSLDVSTISRIHSQIYQQLYFSKIFCLAASVFLLFICGLSKLTTTLRPNQKLYIYKIFSLVVRLLLFSRCCLSSKLRITLKPYQTIRFF